MTDKKGLSFTVVLVVGCALLVGFAFRRIDRSQTSVEKKERSPSDEVAISSAVHGLKIIHLERRAEALIVMLENSGEKGITAVAATVGAFRRSYHTDYVTSEVEEYQQLAPGKSDLFTFQRPDQGEKVLVSAVVFADLTSQGDPREIDYMLDKRKGTKIQLDRITPYLRKVANTKGSAIGSETQKLRQFAEELSLKSDDGWPISEGLESGLQFGREYVLRYVVSALEEEISGSKTQTVPAEQASSLTVSTEQAVRTAVRRIERKVYGLRNRL